VSIKTPEELAKKYADKHALTGTGTIEKKCFLAGFELAKRQYAEKLKQAYLNGEINSFIRKLTEGGEK
jgi:hypothetical protein